MELGEEEEEEPKQPTANTEPDYLNAEQAISLAAESTDAKQLVPNGNGEIPCRLGRSI